jgi:monoamine oxidase
MDVIIIGAGAAGLAAARELAGTRLSVAVLEARDRIGGRCWTRQEPGIAMPIEYGAEFIHGRPPVTMSLLRRFGVEAVARSGTRWFVKLGSLRPRDREAFLDQICRAMLKARPPRKDISFARYLETRLGEHLSADARIMAERMVEGYDAADLDQVSAQAIVREWTSESTGAEVNFRPRGGYGALLGALAAEAVERGVHLRTQSIVRRVKWARGRVDVEGTFLGRPFQMRAARAIVTLPLGVLQLPQTVLGSVRFTPSLGAKRAAFERLASGPALKVILRFRSAFWEKLERGRYRNAGFFQSPQAPFPTFWTAAPLRSPALVAWAGGPRARRYADADADQIVRPALASLRTLFGAGVDIEGELAGAYCHNWQSDPFARGAYSYARVGGMSARKALAAPLLGTLYFAGEAADYAGETGTVAGALQSGICAARALLAAQVRKR